MDPVLFANSERRKILAVQQFIGGIPRQPQHTRYMGRCQHQWKGLSICADMKRTHDRTHTEGLEPGSSIPRVSPF